MNFCLLYLAFCHHFLSFPIFDYFPEFCRLRTNLVPQTLILHANSEDPNTSMPMSEPSEKPSLLSLTSTATPSMPCTRTWWMTLSVPSTWLLSTPDSSVTLSGRLESFPPLSFCLRTTLKRACTKKSRPLCSSPATSMRLPSALMPPPFLNGSKERQRRTSRPSSRMPTTAFSEPPSRASRMTNSGCTPNFSELVFCRSWKRPVLKWTRTTFTLSWKTGCPPNWADHTLPHA